MKFLLFSDIHGIIDNLDKIKVLDEKNDFDKVIVLGDLYYTGSVYEHRDKDVNPVYVRNFLNSFGDKLICLKGNYESATDIENSEFPIISDLSLIYVDGLNLYLTHGNNYNYRNSDVIPEGGILIYGHEHVPYIKQNNGKTFISIGSISIQIKGKPTYSIYENRTFKIFDIDDNIIYSVEM